MPIFTGNRRYETYQHQPLLGLDPFYSDKIKYNKFFIQHKHMSASRKEKKICKLKDFWFSEPEFNGIISEAHLRNTESEVSCLICSKSINISHQGQGDLVRHCTGSGHKKKVLNEKRHQREIDTAFYRRDQHLDVAGRKAEVKINGFLAEHNLPIAVADHIGLLLKDIFPDSKIASAYACGRTKSMNRAIKPDLRAKLTDQMRESFFSISTDGSNDQNLEKMNLETVRLFDMRLSRASTTAAIFSSIDDAFVANDVSWDNCVSLRVDNTSVNVGKHRSLFVEAKKLNPHIMLMGCPCHIAHNTAAKATDALENCVNGLILKNCLWTYISILIIYQNIRIYWLNSVSFVIKSII